MHKRHQIPGVFLAMKFYGAGDIHKEMIVYLRADAVGYSMVTKYLRPASFGSETPDMPVSEEFKMIDQSILKSLEQAQFFSVRELTGFPCLASSRVDRPRRSI
jgi:hypothetical protein